MASSTQRTQPVLPGRLQVALAIAILKSKPEGVTVRAHILELREHLRKGRRVFTSEDDHHRHLDQVAYWRARHDEANQRCQELERRNVQLERWRVSDGASNGLDIDDDLCSKPVPVKRKRAGSKPHRPQKRPKLASSDAAEIDTTDIHEGAGKPPIVIPDVDEVDRVRETLVRKLYLTHKVYRQQNVKPEALCFHLVDTVRAIGSVVAAIPKNYDKLAVGNLKGLTPVEKDRSELASIILSSTRAWASLVVGLQKLSVGSEMHLPSLVVFECVKMIKTIFDSISESARRIASARPATRSQGNEIRTEASITSRDIGHFRPIAQFINALISSLNKDDRHHREIFEGVVFILIERVGRLLFYFTFDRYRSTTIEGDVAMPPTRDDKMGVARQITESMATRLEAQCLITILERAIGLAPYHMNSPLASRRPSSAASRRASNPTRSPTKSLTRASNTPLVAQAKDRLQRTLIQCMFGEEERDDFVDVLRMPGTLGPMPKIARMEDKDVGEWFNGEVWRLIGWDLLSSEAEW